AASQAAEAVSKAAHQLGVREVAVLVKGPGPGRDSAIKSLKAGGLEVTSITDVTPIPHNGPRPKNRRRV
ncbi:MAG: 30S ribosomal protein S11, partial [Patescibacteria group bacterium]